MKKREWRLFLDRQGAIVVLIDAGFASTSRQIQNRRVSRVSMENVKRSDEVDLLTAIRAELLPKTKRWRIL